ncbi:type IV toxin-antitoxin system AbiEi family antitoxin [Arthrobacter sp. MA-N2]|uniref:type IV toxin-antitoxin system AbiEi family antitoxin n=1 Tax=Arthrobacter sp. MA-N2 TaxID=1101188 RepID=UPI0004B7DCCC|nr:type IV toxin-antitoxin system AbiEi family antitoxin [Arthrobacter sp. MA-N2]
MDTGFPPSQQLDSPAQDLYSPSPLFTWAELQSMAADGVLTPLYEKSFTPPGLAVTPRLRARAAALVVPDRIRRKVIAGRMTAAWIYGCADAPERLSLLVDAKHRISSLRSARACILHEVRLGQLDVVSIGGLLVTTPLRTAVDVALYVEADRAVPALRRLLSQEQLGVRLRLLTLAVEAFPRVPYKKAALRKLTALALQQDVLHQDALQTEALPPKAAA